MGDTATLTATGGVNYTWVAAEGLTPNAQDNSKAIFSPTAAGRYTLEVSGKGQNNCSDNTQSAKAISQHSQQARPTTAVHRT